MRPAILELAQTVPVPTETFEWVLKTGGIAGLSLLFAFIALCVASWAVKGRLSEKEARLEDAHTYAAKQEQLLREHVVLAETSKETAVQAKVTNERCAETIERCTEVLKAIGTRGA